MEWLVDNLDIILSVVGAVVAWVGGRWWKVKDIERKYEEAVNTAGRELAKWAPVAQAVADRTANKIDDEVVDFLNKIVDKINSTATDNRIELTEDEKAALLKVKAAIK